MKIKNFIINRGFWLAIIFVMANLVLACSGYVLKSTVLCSFGLFSGCLSSVVFLIKDLLISFEKKTEYKENIDCHHKIGNIVEAINMYGTKYYLNAYEHTIEIICEQHPDDLQEMLKLGANASDCYTNDCMRRLDEYLGDRGYKLGNGVYEIFNGIEELPRTKKDWLFEPAEACGVQRAVFDYYNYMRRKEQAKKCS